MHGRGLRLARGLAALALAAGCLTDLGPSPEPDPAPGGDADPDPAPGDETERRQPRRGLAPAPVPVRGLEHRGHLDAEAGLGVETRGTLAYLASPEGLSVVDVGDPASPERLGIERDAGSRYVDLLAYPDRLVAAASGAHQERLHFVDVTDPARPELLASLDVNRTVHNVAHVPGTHLLYNPRGVGDPVEPGIDVVDARDPAEPEVVHRWPLPATAGAQPTRTTGCAVVTFDVARERAFCPAVDQTYVLDVANRTEPELVSAITNPAITVHHWTATAHDGSTLLIADWATAANAPTCGRAREPLSTGPPAGAVWTYNLSDPANPRPQGHVAIEPPGDLEPGQACSPHVLDPVAGQPVAAAAWHHGGVALVDASDPTDPTVIDRWTGGGDAWAADVAGNRVHVGIRGGGLDVLELTG